LKNADGGWIIKLESKPLFAHLHFKRFLIVGVGIGRHFYHVYFVFTSGILRILFL
jgi:hypothetical protein